MTVLVFKYIINIFCDISIEKELIIVKLVINVITYVYTIEEGWRYYECTN